MARGIYIIYIYIQACYDLNFLSSVFLNLDTSIVLHNSPMHIFISLIFREQNVEVHIDKLQD